MVNLLDPLEVKGLTLKNRIIMPPMYTGLATPQSFVTEELIEHYVQRSEVLGLLIVEHSFVSIEGKLSEKQLGIYTDHLIDGLERLSSRIHATGTPVVIQINHAGGATSKEVTGMQPVAPSPSEDAIELQIEHIERLTEDFAMAAERAMKAGFDGVEVHGAHGFLLNQFFSPLTNRRRDKYGGSLEKRMNFPLRIVEAVKERIGRRLLMYRLASDDLKPEGIRIEDSAKLAVELQRAGVDIIDVSGGLCGSRPPQLQGRQGYFIPQAQQIKKAVDIPVVGVGGITEPEFANKVIQTKRVDLVAVGRALFKNPNWAEQAIKTLKTS